MNFTPTSSPNPAYTAVETPKMRSDGNSKMSKLPSAKATLKSLNIELDRKGLGGVVGRLPALRNIRVERQGFHESEYPLKILIGTEKKKNGKEVWAVLGRKPKSADSNGSAPDMSFYEGSTDFATEALSSCQQLEVVSLVEPFRDLWEKTRNLVLTIKSRNAWDKRRGYFKSLMYWYYLQDGAAKCEDFRFPETIRKTYIAKAFQILAQETPGVQEPDVPRDAAGDIAATLRKLAGYEAQQKEVEILMHGKHDECEEERKFEKKAKALEEEIQKEQEAQKN